MYDSQIPRSEGRASSLPARSSFSATRIKRSNHEWIAALTGAAGHNDQQIAHQDLANYLFVVVHNHLLNRRSEFIRLSTLAQEEVRNLAQDLVQGCLEKLSRDDFALLTQFSGRGSFTSWTAQIVLNQARSELFRARWSRLQPLDDSTSTFVQESPSPEQIVLD